MTQTGMFVNSASPHFGVVPFWFASRPKRRVRSKKRVTEEAGSGDWSAEPRGQSSGSRDGGKARLVDGSSVFEVAHRASANRL